MCHDTEYEDERSGDDPGKSTYRLLADEERRDLLSYLRRERVATVDDLIEVLVDAERSEMEARIKLSHVHLPKLVEHGVVEFDERSGALRYWEDERLEVLLGTTEEVDESECDAE